MTVPGTFVLEENFLENFVFKISIKFFSEFFFEIFPKNYNKLVYN